VCKCMRAPFMYGKQRTLAHSRCTGHFAQSGMCAVARGVTGALYGFVEP
jgi:hypothetical protein